MTTLASRLARAVVTRYPPAWRDRYEDEVLALFDESPPGYRDVAELARGMVVERARALLESTDRPSRTLTMLGAVRPTFAVVFALAAAGLGYLLRQTVPAPSTAAWVDWLLVVTFFTTLGLHVYWRRRYRRRGGPDVAVPAWAAIAALSATFAAFVVFEWAGRLDSKAPVGLQRLNLIYTYAIVGGFLSSDLWPGRRLWWALNHLIVAESQLAGAQRWVAGCHEMIARGVASPLADAEADVARWTDERETARRTVEQLGYSARFPKI